MFTPIETQEQLDALLKERLTRDRESQAKKYEGWTSPEDLQKLTEGYNEKIKAMESAAAATKKTLEEKDAVIAESAKYRTDLAKTKIALEVGIPYEMAGRLTGETEEEIKADAEALAKLIGKQKQVAPLGSGEPELGGKGKDAAWKKFAASITSD